jgi:hypothetical protein
VSYEPPREVVARYTSGDSLRIAGVREITGTVTRAVPDTLFVRLVEGPTSLSTARDVPGPGPIPRDAIVAVPQEAGVAISAYRLNKKANLVALGVVAALAGVLALMLATAEWDYR